MDSEENPKPDTPKPDNDTPVPAPIRAENKKVLSEHKKEPCHERVNVTVNVPRDWVPIVINGALAVIGVIAICVYGGQLQVMKGQLRLTRDQLKGTQAAFMFYNVAMDPPYSAVNIAFKNTGHVTANDFSAHVTITRKTLPDLKPIGESVVGTVAPQPVEPYPIEDPIGRTYEVPNFGEKGWNAMDALEQAIFVETAISYGNGFDETPIKVGDCKFFLYSNFQARNGQIVSFNNGPWPCDNFDRMFEDAKNSRKAAESEAERQKSVNKSN